MAAWTHQERVNSVYEQNRYKIDITLNTRMYSVSEAQNTFASITAGTVTDQDIKEYLTVLYALDKATISGPEEIVAEALIEVLENGIGAVKFDTTGNYAYINICEVPITGVPTAAGAMPFVIGGSAANNIFQIRDQDSPNVVTSHLLNCASALTNSWLSNHLSWYYLATKSDASEWSDSATTNCANTGFNPATTTTYTEVTNLGDMVAICQGVAQDSLSIV